MEYWQAGMIRHIVQHHIKLHDQEWRERFVELLDLESEELEVFEQFCGGVSCHILERLVIEREV